jgi:S-formylglutathione hydrolase
VTLETLSSAKSFGGTQLACRHSSRETGTDMTFGIYLPPQAAAGAPLPVLWFLSGLTCTHANVVEKGQYQRACAELGLILVAPDTSPRGPDVPDEPDYDFGQGAGFYVDSTEAPFAASYRMYSYVAAELPDLVASEFPADMERQSITGHSMGGHGALTLALRNPGRYRSVSAFAPIVAPGRVPWGEKALGRYLGPDRAAWRAHDSVALIEDGARVPEILVDQGDCDSFLERELRPDLLEAACSEAGIDLTLRMQPGYDHSYYFISTFMEDHLRWHWERLSRRHPGESRDLGTRSLGGSPRGPGFRRGDE